MFLPSMQNCGTGILKQSHNKSLRSILVCRTDRMGDVILALPAARALKLTYPSAKVVFLCREYTKPLLSMCPWLDGVITIDRPGKQVLEDIRAHGFDAAVCLWQEARVVKWLSQAKIPLRVGSGTRLRSLRFQRRLFEHRKWGLRHEVYYNLNIAMQFGIGGIPEPLWEWDIPTEAESRVAEILSQHSVSTDSRLIILHPGSGQSAKDWPLGHFANLAKHQAARGKSVLLTGSQSERAAIDEFSHQAGGMPNLAGELTIPELAALFKRSWLVVANSTGPLHLANSLGTPVIGLFPLDRSMHPRRWGPLGQLDHVLTPESHKTDMASISVDRVATLADKLTESESRIAVTHWHKPPPLSVLITITSPWWNAAAYIAIGLAAGLRDRGHQVWVMARQGMPAFVKASDLGLRTIALPLHMQDPITVVRNVLQIKSILQKLPVTLINAHCPTGHSQVAAALLDMGRNTPLIRTACDPRPPYRNIANRWLLQKGTDAIIVTCDASRQRYIDRFDGIAEKTFVIPGGIDPFPFLDLNRDLDQSGDADIVVGVVSRLSPVKGHNVFLQAAAKAAAQSPRLRFVISGEEAQVSHDDLRQLAISLGIGDRVQIIGRVEDVREVLTKLHIGVVSSVGSEVVCRIAMEMMAAGLPVIGTSVNAIGETVQDNVTGIVVPPNDPNRLADAMLRLADDGELRRRMGQAGRARIIQELSLEKMVDRTEEIYRLALNRRISEYLPVISEAH
jgi:heptosyltransferase-3